MVSSQTEVSPYAEAFEENLRRISKASSDLYHLLCMGTWRSAGCRVEAHAILGRPLSRVLPVALSGSVATPCGARQGGQVRWRRGGKGG
jgi:hypothetical protein